MGDRDRIVICIYKDHGWFVGTSFDIWHRGIRDDDDLVSDGALAGRGSVQTDVPATLGTRDHIGLKTFAIVDVHHGYFFVGDQIGGIHQFLIDGQTSLVIEVGLRDARAMKFRFEHDAIHGVLGVVGQNGRQNYRFPWQTTYQLAVWYLRAMKVSLSKIAHARSGDKGDAANCGVIAYKQEWYPIVRDQLTAERVKEHFTGICLGPVDRYEMPNLWAVNFVLHKTLGGGGTVSLKLDAQGKTVATAMLLMEIDVPDNLFD